MMQPLGRDRWLFRYSYGDHHDGLVHRVLAAYRSRYEQRALHVYPTEGITECGVLTSLVPGHPLGVCHEGTYLDDGHFPTCIRCVSGVSKDGVSFRQTEKNAQFARIYGMTGRSRAAARPVGGTYGVAYLDEAIQFSEAEKKLLAVYDPWGASILASSPKP